MERQELALCLATTTDEERAALLSRHAALADTALAQTLKTLFDETKIGDPRRASGAAAALATLARVSDDPETHALAAWTSGMAALLLDGQADRAIRYVDDAAARFTALGQFTTAATTQVSKLAALAILGRYEEAIDCGLRLRQAFLEQGDQLAVGKVEQNLGNLYARRDRYQVAETCYRAARERFLAVGDRRQLVQVDIGLANVLALRHDFRAAATLYEEALATAEAAELAVAQAVIECDLGCLALFQGHYDRALALLEQSRRRYATLGMAHKSALADQELATAYLELNLVPEAAAIYERVRPTFADLGMRAELAAATASHGHACLLLGQPEWARALLAEARDLYGAEDNAVGKATVLLHEAFLAYQAGDHGRVVATTLEAEPPLARAGTRGRLLLARWLRGEALRLLGQEDEARQLLAETLREAEREAVPQVAQRCETSLGRLAFTRGEVAAAEAAFQRAVAIIEALRAPLPAEEFRTAFIADKLTPYAELVRLCLAERRVDRAIEALTYVERARSRALVELLGGTLPPRHQPRDPFEAEILARLEALREELNWFYSQINRPPDGALARGAATMTALHAAVREREAEVLTLSRQSRQRGGDPLVTSEPVDIAGLQRDLGAETALVEYYSLDGELLAFIVTDEGVNVVRDLGAEASAEALLGQLRFQLDVFRHGSAGLHRHLEQLTRRARHHLAALYELLLAPLDGLLGGRRLVVVPHRALHYVPFHALYDGTGYVIERREVCYAPSASVLRHCLAAPRRPRDRAVLLGVADPWTPRVRDEVETLATLFPQATALLDGEATLAALTRHAPGADVVHLACHGHFRRDNPLFSSVRLANGWLTVRDAYQLDLCCELVTLSACETGVSDIAPGDELIGLARGFFSAGARSLLASLWPVDDAATATLMTCFYERVRAGDSLAAALRQAQRAVLATHSHPYYWSSFVLFGRW